MCEEAAELFDELIAEAPIYVELWYFRAISLINLANENQENLTESCYTAAHHLLRAKKMLEDDPDEEMIASVNTQLNNLASIGVDLERVEAELVIELEEEKGNAIDDSAQKITDEEILQIAEETQRELDELDQQRAAEEQEHSDEDNEDEDDEDDEMGFGIEMKESNDAM